MRKLPTKNSSSAHLRASALIVSDFRVFLCFLWQSSFGCGRSLQVASEVIDLFCVEDLVVAREETAERGLVDLHFRAADT